MLDKKTEKKLKKLEIESKIEYQRRINENPIGSSFKPIFFTEIKYKSNPELFLDIRQFQRGYNEEGEEVYHPTKIGFRLSKNTFISSVLSKMVLVPGKY
ncbi:MAG: hypothetical protein LBU87_07215, partial [Lactobacillales bacterium]|nr:hypothetical protein [Lactobacillales bacterium]